MRYAHTYLVSIAAAPAVPSWITSQGAGTWAELTGTNPVTASLCPLNNCSYSGNQGFSGLFDSWNGGIYDSFRDRLICWGGGHGAYFGNELIAFDLATRNWSRITIPFSPITNADLVGGGGTNTTGYYADGTPASRHTYNAIQYDFVRDQLISGYAGATAGQTGGQFRNCDAFNLSTNAWSVKAQPPTLGSYGSPYGTTSAVDSAGNFWMVYAGLAPTAKYDPAANLWTTYGSGYNYGGAYLTSAVDTLRNRFVSIGSGFFTKIDLNSPATTSDVGGTPNSTLLNAQAPGWTYDPIGDRFIGWTGGQTLYTVDAATLLVWGTITIAGGSATPPANNEVGYNWTGTYGKFRYSQKYDGIVVSVQAAMNVFFYKFAR